MTEAGLPYQTSQAQTVSEITSCPAIRRRTLSPSLSNTKVVTIFVDEVDQAYREYISTLTLKDTFLLEFFDSLPT